jgi:pyruvate formate lyase activating enzyme
MKIPVADIRRLTLHDGPGTRTTVFIKGCPLRCVWCHNPESLSATPLLLFHDNLCSGCGSCAVVCPTGVHAFDGGAHQLDRSRCRACGACVEACPRGALEICGRDYSPEELLPLLLRDEAFYASGGGVTVSGGEPLLYAEAVGRLFGLLHAHSIRTAVDTCGEVPFEAFERVLPDTDLVLFDIKGMDPVRHRENTGRDNTRIHENLRRLGALGVPVEIRMPVVPGRNDALEEFEAAARLLAEVPSVTKVRLLPYRSLARKKYRDAGLADTMPDAPTPDAAFLEERAAILRRHGLTVELAR